MTAARDAAVFRLSTDKPMKNLLPGVVLLLGVSVWAAREHGGRAIGLTAGVGLLVLAWTHWRSARKRELAVADRAPKLVVDARALTIPELFEHPVPWDAIERIAFYKGRRGAYLSFAMRQPGPAQAPGMLGRLFGAGGLAFDYSALDCDRAQLVAALKRYAPPRLSDQLR